MEKINFIIVGSVDTENSLDLKREIEKKGHEAILVKIKDFLFKFDRDNQSFDVLYQGKSLENFDIFIFRGYNKSFAEAQIIAEWLQRKSKVILDDYLLKKFVPSKILEVERFAKNNIPHMETFQALNFEVWTEVFSKIKFPAVVKPINAQKGQGVALIKSKQDALIFFQKNPRGYMLQEYMKIDGDIRVFVVGGKVLGAMKRFVPENDIRSNVSLGAKTEKIEMNDDLEKLAIDATSAMEYEIAGVDIIENEGKYYVLEVNVAPQWQGFKQSTGINPAEYIIDYALEKYEKNKDRIF